MRGHITPKNANGALRPNQNYCGTRRHTEKRSRTLAIYVGRVLYRSCASQCMRKKGCLDTTESNEASSYIICSWTMSASLRWVLIYEKLYWKFLKARYTARILQLMLIINKLSDLTEEKRAHSLKAICL